MSRKSVSLFVFLLFLSSSSLVTADNHLHSKAEFFKQNVPKGRDFTNIDENARYRPNHLLVRFASKPDGKRSNISEKKHILNALGGASIKLNFMETPGLTLVKLPPGQSIEEALKIYNSRDDILYAEPDYEISLNWIDPNDTYFADLWGMHNTGQSHPITGGGTSSGTPGADIDAPEAWDIITDANDIIVAVIDTGIDYTHPDLATNMWKTNEDPNDANDDGYPGIGGVDDDGDGLIDEDSNGTSRYIDVENEIEDPNWTNDLFEDDDENGYANDIYGYDFCSRFKVWDPDPNDDHFHGTHVAGTIGAIGNNNEGVTGVCWKVKIMALKFLASDGYGNTSDAIECINYAIVNKANILSNSWGGGGESQSLKDKIEEAQQQGILFVAAAGNYSSWPPGDNPDIEEKKHYPASYDLENIITVMATDHNDNVPGFSNYGKKSVDLAAPGDDILSTFPTFVTDEMAYYGFSTNYETIYGTSMACPHVAGACALVWAQHPDWSWQMVKATILNSVDKLDSLGYPANPEPLCVTRGRLNLHKALTSKPPFLSISKTDDFTDPNLCGVEPNDIITYTIDYANPQEDQYAADFLGTASFVLITDYLPLCSQLVEVIPDTGTFNLWNYTYTWYVFNLAPGDSGTMTLKVLVTEEAEPSGQLKNEVTIESENAYNSATEETPICCWNELGIIYVDKDAADGANTGASWFNAYTNITYALDRAVEGCGTEIWVADGTYSPGADDEATFELLEDVALYGGFAGNETSREQRNWTANPTVLTGYETCDAIVTADELNFAVLDGFIIQNADQYGVQCSNSDLHIAHCLIQSNGGDGIYCNNADPNISYCTIRYNSNGIECNQSDPLITNCIMENNYGHGIYCEQSDPNIFHSILRDNSGDGLYAQNTSSPLLYECLIEENGSDGIECKGSNSFLIASNSKIHANADHGIYLFQAAAEINNNWIHHNQQNGIQLNYGSPTTTIRNNTIVYNVDTGIKQNSGTSPTVKNCILWGNETQLSGTISPTYSCIQGVTMPNGNHNIDNYPEFAYPDPGSHNFHLDPYSACIDAGDDSGIDPNETDIDGDVRLDYSPVDIGADEVACSDVSNAADFNGDGIVNLLDYAPLAAYWLTDDNEGQDPNWPHEYDLITDDQINLLDLNAFCNNWLWTACYYSNDWFVMEMMMSSSSGGFDGIGFGMAAGQAYAGLKSTPTMVVKKTPSPPVELTAEQLAELIEDLKKLWEESDEEFRREVGEDSWEEFLKYLYEKLERLRQSEEKK